MEDIIKTINDFISEDVNQTITKSQENDIINFFKDIESHSINISNITDYVISLMKIIETIDKVKGVDKKKLVIFIIKKIVDKNIDDNYEREILFYFIDNMLPNVIDTIISIDKKKIIISVNKAKSLFKKIFSCVSKP
jgi:hypothetical protein